MPGPRTISGTFIGQACFRSVKNSLALRNSSGAVRSGEENSGLLPAKGDAGSRESANPMTAQTESPGSKFWTYIPFVKLSNKPFLRRRFPCCSTV